MKIAIVGPGAMGCLFAYFLSRSGENVWLLDKNEERAGQIKREGLKIEGLSGDHIVPMQRITTHPEEIGPTDIVVLCVKSYDTEKAIAGAAPLVSKGGTALTLQNGLNNLQKMRAHVGDGQILGGVTSHGATLLGPGHVRHAGAGETTLGPLDEGGMDRARTVCALFEKAGVSAEITRDVKSVIWGKLLINVGINPLTALLKVRNGALLESPDARGAMKSAVEEAYGIAQAEGVTLPYDNPVAKVDAVCRATAANRSSMLQDVLAGRRTEIDSINGAIVEEGARLAVPTPINYALTLLVKALGQKRM
jgi:2-dehydropantoate 2-reductase